uniref:Pseudouridylate synthase 1 homolog n=1 Tax=Lygus hesperus TaxID=30085 RepID=A0A0A9W1T9_LYGHE
MLASRTSSFTSRLLQSLRPAHYLRMSATVAAEESPGLPQKRPHEDGDTQEDVQGKKPRPEFQRIKRRKYAVLICYSGQGYLGLQRNPGMKTIEEDLLKAWLEAGVITDEAFANAKAIEFQRAARTDKGVSAVRQILSAKLPLEVNVEAVNQHLPEQIRMVALKRATKGFNCKGNADARTYSYMMPSFALASKDDLISPDYRITKETLDRTNQVLSIYLGTHNYHNFTSKKSFADPSSNRYIIKMSCDEPVVCEGMEFVTVYVKGQSFMLHQIRKMVGLAIAVVRGCCSESVISKAWAEEKLDIPIAPGLGLVLEEVHYDRYNQRYGSDGMHEAIEWSSVKPTLDDFKHKFILTSIVRTEKEENSMKSWLETLPMHTFDIRKAHRQHALSAENGGNEDNEDEVEEDGIKEKSEETSTISKNNAEDSSKTNGTVLEEVSKLEEKSDEAKS